MTTARTIDIVRALDAAHTRHPDLDWIVLDALEVPYRIDPASSTVYLDGRSGPEQVSRALLAGVAALDELHARCPIIPLISRRARAGQLRTG